MYMINTTKPDQNSTPRVQHLTEAEVANAVAEYYRRLSTAILPDEIWPDIVNGHWGTIHPLYPEPIPE